MHPHIAGHPKRSSQIAAAGTNRPDRPHGHKKREIRKECRTVVSQKTDTRVLTIPAISRCSAKARPPSTRKEAQSPETMLAQSHATFAIASRARISKEYATQPRWQLLQPTQLPGATVCAPVAAWVPSGVV